MPGLACLAGLFFGACSAPPAPVAGSTGSGSVVRAAVSGDEAGQPERLAAIQKAMNELDEAAQQCWAAAAVERLDIEGEITAQIDIDTSSARATVINDTTRNSTLSVCLIRLLGAYQWAPPLHGQSIQLPFKFRAPDSQNVIDRRLVPWKQQGKVAVAVLFDEANSGNDVFSLFDVRIDAGGSTGMRIAERTELWFLLKAAKVKYGKKDADSTFGLEFFYVPAGAAREIMPAPETPLEAFVMVLPGGKEGSARAGALPTREGAWRSGQPVPKLLSTLATKTIKRPGGGEVHIMAEPATTGAKDVSGAITFLRAGTMIPEHVHTAETEVLYVWQGNGTLTVNGIAMAVTETSVVQIPPNTKHAFTATTDVHAIQMYTPAGPEQRFKATP